MSDHNRFKQKLGQGLCLLCKVNNKMIRKLINDLKKDDGNGTGEPSTPPDPTDPDPTDPVDPTDPTDPVDPVDPPDDTGGGTTSGMETAPMSFSTTSVMYKTGTSDTAYVELPISLRIERIDLLAVDKEVIWKLTRNGIEVGNSEGLNLAGIQSSYADRTLYITIQGGTVKSDNDYVFSLADDTPPCTAILNALSPVGLVKKVGEFYNEVRVHNFSTKIYNYQFHCDQEVAVPYANLRVPPVLLKHITSFEKMFSDNALFNDPVILDWDVSDVVNMNQAFSNCPSLDQSFWKWHVANVEVMDYMFFNCSKINVDFRLWCVPKIPSLPTGFVQNSSQHLDYLPVWGTCPSGIEVPPTEESGEYTQTVDPVSGIPLNILRERADPDYVPTNLSVITISKNGGEAKTFTEVHLNDGTIEEALNGGVLFNSVLFINYPLEIGATENIYDGRNIFCGINEDGSINTPDGSKLNITNDTLLYSYTPPHTVEAAVNTITIYPSDTKGGTLNDAYCTFNGSESGSPLTIQSNAILTFKQD